MSDKANNNLNIPGVNSVRAAFKKCINKADSVQTATGNERRRPSRLEEIYKKYQQELLNYVRQKVGTGPIDPEDVVQGVFAKFTSLPEGYKIDNPRAFLFQAVRNSIIDQGRQAKTSERHAREAARDSVHLGENCDGMSPEKIYLVKEELATLQDIFKNMPERRRRIFLMNRLDGQSYAAIARDLKISQTTVKYHVAMALQDCATALEEMTAKPDEIKP